MRPAPGPKRGNEYRHQRQAVPMSRRVEELDGTERGQHDGGDRPAPGILRCEDSEQHRRLHQPGKHQRVAKADEVGPKHAERGCVDEVDVPRVHVLHLQVERFARQDSLRDVGVVPFVGWIPESVVVGAEQEHGRQHRDRSGRGALRHPSPTRGRPSWTPGTAPDDGIDDVVVEVDRHVGEQRERHDASREQPKDAIDVEVQGGTESPAHERVEHHVTGLADRRQEPALRLDAFPEAVGIEHPHDEHVLKVVPDVQHEPAGVDV